MIRLRDSFMETEKGNTMLVNDDGCMVAWIQLDHGRYLEIADTPGNSPRLYVTIEKTTPKRLRKHVLENLRGWTVVRWNLDQSPPTDSNSEVVREENEGGE